MGEGVLVLDTDADVPVEHLGQGAGSQRIGALVEHQLLHDADAQAAGDHGQDRLVLLDGVLNPGPDLVVIENGLDLIVVALIQQDEGVLLQGLRRERLAARQRVVAGQDDLPLVPLEQPVVQILLRRGGQGDKAAVRLTVEDPVGDLVVEVGGQELELNAGVLFLKGLEHTGQPLFRHTGEGCHADKAGVQSPQVLGVLLQTVGQGAHLLKIWCQGAAIRRGGDTAVAADQQRNAQLLLQRADGVADAGLGEIQGAGGGGKAAQLHGLEVYLVFGDGHGDTSFRSSIAYLAMCCKVFFMVLMIIMRFTNHLSCAMLKIR